VAQLMSEKVVTALPKTTIFEAEKTMSSQGFRRLLYFRRQGRRHRDGNGHSTVLWLRRRFQAFEVGDDDPSVGNARARDCFEERSTVEPETDVGKAAKIMREKDIGAVPVSRTGDLSASSLKETSSR